MLFQAYRKALQQYFLFIIIGLVMAAVTAIFWLGLPFYVWGSSWSPAGNLPVFLHQGLLYSSIGFLLMLYFAPFHWQVAKNMPHAKRSFAGIQLLMTVICAAAIYGLFMWNEGRSQAEFATEVYEFPAGFQGCAIIFYDVADAPPLEIVEERLVMRFEGKGEVLLTSSPQQFGWANDDHSGWRSTEIYVGDEQLEGDAFQMSIGSFESDDLQFDYMQIIAAETASCYTDFEYPEPLYKRFVPEGAMD